MLNSTIFQGINKDSLVHISPLNRIFPSDELEYCLTEFEDFKHLFNSILIISWDLLRYDKWEQILRVWDLRKNKIAFWKTQEIWKKLKLNGVFM